MKKKKIKAIARAAQAAAAKSGKPAQPGKPVQSGKPARAGKSKEERRMQKIEQRRREKAKITPSQWAAPAPSHLVGKREVPKVKSKYQSYFEFAENTEKKKKLEFKASVCFIASECELISPLGHQRHQPPAWLCIRPDRRSRNDQHVQRPFPHSRCHDIYCFSKTAHPILVRDPTDHPTRPQEKGIPKYPNICTVQATTFEKR